MRINHKSKKYSSNAGFTLVELLVVVAIIGILAAIAIPNFKKYQAKAKTSEAKLHLASIYMAEQSLMADYDSFATCLNFAGYVGPTTGNYYSLGFALPSSANTTVITNGGQQCVPGDKLYWKANKKVGGSMTVPGNLQFIKIGSFSNGPTVNPTGNAFIAGAIGYVSADKASNLSVADSWAIDENKKLVHVVTGY